MKNDIIENLAKLLADKNIGIGYKTNTVFGSLDMFNRSNAAMAEITQNIANAALNEVSLIKNKLLPLMYDYMEIFNGIVSSIKKTSAKDDYEIKEVALPKIVLELKNKGILQPVREFRNIPVTSLTIDPTNLDLQKMLILNDVILNEYAKEITAKYSNAQLTEIWKSVFLNISATNLYISYLPNKTQSELDNIIVMWIICENLLANTNYNTNTSLDTYTNSLSLLKNELLNLIAKAEFEHNLFIKLNRLIIKRVSPTSIIINKDVYDRVLKEENNTINGDVLIGYIMSGDADNIDNCTVDAIKTNANKYLGLLDQKTKIQNIIKINDEVKNIKSAYSLGLYAFYNNIPDNVKEFVRSDIKLVEDTINNYVNSLSQSDILNTDITIKNIFGIVILNYPNFHTFTESMTEFSKLNPSITSKEAASLATIDLVLTYLLQQLDIENNIIK